MCDCLAARTPNGLCYCYHLNVLLVPTRMVLLSAIYQHTLICCALRWFVPILKLAPLFSRPSMRSGDDTNESWHSLQVDEQLLRDEAVNSTARSCDQGNIGFEVKCQLQQQRKPTTGSVAH